ncbi:MAG: hypothetical protein BJ554DRAFT_8030 [Olpidium bornovanus]|uniref:Uncharacterized protein n=1 Tax=Olpidium bornovanus TaxID=278681 RepID=A0A8H7ZUY5_9FUNG|nr:MAG: hypothetical protein BJ554DRAFT_8030 [Olpidium bornovanus]
MTNDRLATAAAPAQKRKPISWENIALGAFIQVFEVTTLGQVFEVVKTHMAGARTLNTVWRVGSDDHGICSCAQYFFSRPACKAIHARGGLPAFYQGLIPVSGPRPPVPSPSVASPWAWIEASTKGGVLLFSSSEIEGQARRAGASKEVAGLLGGMGGGVCQACEFLGSATALADPGGYGRTQERTTLMLNKHLYVPRHLSPVRRLAGARSLGMGVCTFMKTVEVTRKKSAGQVKSTWQVAAEVWKKEGIRGLNKGVSAVALRQMTNWGSRFGKAAAPRTASFSFCFRGLPLDRSS